MAKRLVFLDIDGVIVLKSPDGEKVTPPEQMERLNTICDHTGAQIIISSSRRHGKSIARIHNEFRGLGLRHSVIGGTPEFVEMGREKLRGLEILACLMSHWPVESYVILDDGAYGLLRLPLLHPRFVRTLGSDRSGARSMQDSGLQDEHVAAAVALLETPVDWACGVV